MSGDATDMIEGQSLGMKAHKSDYLLRSVKIALCMKFLLAVVFGRCNLDVVSIKDVRGLTSNRGVYACACYAIAGCE